MKYNFNRDKMPRVTHVKAARKDNSAVKKGEPYYWWKFRFGGKIYSKTRPRRSQLTQSSFFSQLWDLEDEISGCTTPSTGDDAQALVEDYCDRIREIGSECEESLQNMPESLQYSPTGELLQERIDGMEEMASEMENIDCDVDDVEEANTFDTPEEWQEALDNHETAMEDVASEIQAIQYEG